MKLKFYCITATICCTLLAGLSSIATNVQAQGTDAAPTKPVSGLEKQTIQKNVKVTKTTITEDGTKTEEVTQKAPEAEVSLQKAVDLNQQKAASGEKADEPAPKAVVSTEGADEGQKKPNGETNLPIPRFVSIKSDEVNVRAGPGNNYPIKWVVIKKALPVEIIGEFEHWRKIRDISGDEGWVHSSMVTGYRTGIISEKSVEIRSSNDAKSSVVATIEKGVVVNIDTCDNSVCSVSIEKVKGFLPRTALWGLYKNETIK